MSEASNNPTQELSGYFPEEPLAVCGSGSKTFSASGFPD
jgi:hypothetical protein